MMTVLFTDDDSCVTEVMNRHRFVYGSFSKILRRYWQHPGCRIKFVVRDPQVARRWSAQLGLRIEPTNEALPALQEDDRVILPLTSDEVSDQAVLF